MYLVPGYIDNSAQDILSVLLFVYLDTGVMM